MRGSPYYFALAFSLIFLVLPRELRAEVTAEIVALGDGGRALLGQPIYLDAVYKNETSKAFLVAAGATADRWEFREDAASAIRACSPRRATSDRKWGGPGEPVAFLDPGQSRTEREVILDELCANLPRRAGRVLIRVRLEGIGQSVPSPWRSLDLVAPTGKEAEAIAAAPHAHNDLEGFLRKFGDTAVAAAFLREQNEIDARDDWTSKRSFEERVRAVSRNARWAKSVREWRLRTTEGLIRRHPDSYFAAELSAELAAMYAMQGDATGVERMAHVLRGTDPIEAAQVRETAQRMRTGVTSQK